MSMHQDELGLVYQQENVAMSVPVSDTDWAAHSARLHDFEGQFRRFPSMAEKIEWENLLANDHVHREGRQAPIPAQNLSQFPLEIKNLE